MNDRPRGPQAASPRSPGTAPALALLLPGDIDTPTGGYLYDRRMVQELRARDWPVEVIALDASFPAPTPAALAQAERALAALPDGALVLADGLAFGAMPALAAAHGPRLRLVALVHHPLAHETGLEAARARQLHESERAALRQVRAVVVTSPETAATLQRDYAVAAAQIEVVEPGTDVPAPDSARRHAAPDANTDTHATTRLRLLCVATLAPRKGHELLLRALAAIEPAHRPRLDCLGSTTRDPAQAARLQDLVQRLGLAGDVWFHGECAPPAVAAAFAAADLFVLGSWYEGYGMAVAEAIACGLPVIATAGGATDHLMAGPGATRIPSARRELELPGAHVSQPWILEPSPEAAGELLATALRDLPTQRTAAVAFADKVRSAFPWDAAAESLVKLATAGMARRQVVLPSAPRPEPVVELPTVAKPATPPVAASR